MFGLGPWRAYTDRVAALRQRVLEDGSGVWELFASVFVTVRQLPAPLPAAYAAQAVVALLAAAAVFLAWRRPVAPASRKAVLVACTLVATPYVQAYDLVAAALVPLWLWTGEAAGAARGRPGLDAVAVLAVAAPIWGLTIALAAGFGATGPLMAVAALLAVRRVFEGGAAAPDRRLAMPLPAESGR